MKNVTIIVRNSMAYPQTLKKKIPVARVVVANQVPKPQIWLGMIEILSEAQGIQTQKLTTKQKQEKPFEKLDLSGLGSWPPELTDSAQSLLAEYHDIYSLEPSKLSCTHSTKHVIKVTDDTLFKEWFRQSPPPLLEEVHAHLWGMLDSGTICPSQSAWCNAVVLVWKMDGSLCFCIDFCHLNSHMKKYCYQLPWIQELLESLVITGHFSCLDLMSGYWLIKESLWLKLLSLPLDAEQRWRPANAPWPDPHGEFGAVNCGMYERFAAMNSDLCEEAFAIMRYTHQWALVAILEENMEGMSHTCQHSGRHPCSDSH